MEATRFRLQVSAGETVRRLDQFLASQLPRRFDIDASRRQLRRLIERGGVYVDGKRTRVSSRRLRTGAMIEVYWNPSRASDKKPPVLITAEQILFEDEDLIAVDKPSGLPTQATIDDAENHLLAHLERFLAEREGRKPYLALHQRLDLGTSGLVLLARHPRVNQGLAKMFRERLIDKTYAALCAGENPPASGKFRVQNRLAPVKRNMVASASGGKSSVSEFRFLELLRMPTEQAPTEQAPGTPWLALIEARPLTGRKHQLRVHLADAGWPVVGDRRYGRCTDEPKTSRLHLHAHRLVFEHPTRGGMLRLESPLPDWALF